MNGDEPIHPDRPLDVEPPVEAPPAEPPRQQLRQELLQRFEQWLDRMLADEAPPQGLPAQFIEEVQARMDGAPPDASADLYALFSALTGLKGEIGLQGRTFKQLADSIGPLAEMPARLSRLETAQVVTSEQLAAVLDQIQKSGSSDTGLPAPKDLLKVLFDLCDRLERGIKTFDDSVETLREKTPSGWLARFSGSAASVQETIAATDAMREGYRLTLARLEAAFHEWGIERIGEAGDPFDPQWMTAVEVETSDEEPDGTVLEVYRSGYMLHGQVLATAQVKVAKRN